MKVEGVNCGSLPPVRQSRDFGLIDSISSLWSPKYMDHALSCLPFSAWPLCE